MPLASMEERCKVYGEEIDRLRAEVAELSALVQCLIDNDPNDMAADAVTVLDVWRKDASALLAKTQKD